MSEIIKELSVILPTYNESESLSLTIENLCSEIKELDFEIIVVDDNSPDKTWKIAEELSKTNKRIKLIRRLNSKGLSTAIFAGMIKSKGKVIAVMDADMQHDEKILPSIFSSIANDGFDICLGSREVDKGGYGDLSSLRKITSLIARYLAFLSTSTKVKDPMSGYFALSREYFYRTYESINPSGFKILLEFINRGSNPKIKEIGYTFRKRLYGKTKLTATVSLEYLLTLIDLRFGWFIPNRFVKFALVGFIGSLINFLGFAVIDSLEFSLSISIFIGVQLGILWSYSANNFFTFSPFRYSGLSFFKGLVIYEFLSIFGLLIQFSVVNSFLSLWPSLGYSFVTLYFVYFVGVLFAAVCNYYIHTNYTWNKLGFTLVKPFKSL
jgi:dolichol-phosphate mannosyltransferase